MITSFFKNYEKFFKRASTLFVGYSSGQLISLLSLPIITHFYTPLNFGIYSILFSLVMILQSFSSLRYEYALPLAKKEKAANSLFKLCIMTLLGVCFCLLLLCILFSQLNQRYFHESFPLHILFLLPLGVFAQGVLQIYNFWYTRTGHMKMVAFIKIARCAFIPLFQVVFGFFSVYSAFSLSLGYVAAMLFLAILFSFFVRPIRIFRRSSLKTLQWSAIKYKKFPLMNSWSGGLNKAMLWMPIYFITHFYGSAAAGVYSLTVRGISSPTAVLGTAISQSLYVQVVELSSKLKDVQRFVLKTLKMMCLLGGAYLFLLIAISYFIAYILGGEWSGVGNVIRILSPGIMFIFIVSPLSMTILGMHKNELVMIWQVVAILVTFVALIVGGFFLHFKPMLALLCVTNVAMYLFYLYLIFKSCGIKLGAWVARQKVTNVET